MISSGYVQIMTVFFISYSIPSLFLASSFVTISKKMRCPKTHFPCWSSQRGCPDTDTGYIYDRRIGWVCDSLLEGGSISSRVLLKPILLRTVHSARSDSIQLNSTGQLSWVGSSQIGHDDRARSDSTQSIPYRRYQVDDAARRFTWLLTFLAACGLLLWLVSQKIMYLQSNPKNVNLDFNFNDTLPFPAVTICNQSPFR